MVLDLVYKYFKMWLWILIGLNIITKVHGFANGKFPQSCESLLPQHDGRTPMNSEPPFEMIVDQKGDTITVSLQSKQSTPFRGFMLDARQKGNRAVGKFILLEPDNTRLLTCNNFADTAVNAIVGMNFVCFLVVVKTELPNILATTLHNSPLSCCLNKVLKILCSLLCVAVEITAVVLFCLADTIKVTLVALVCVAIVFDFIKLVIVCLPIGPSHELKEICDLMVNVCSVIHVIFTTTVVFVGVLEMDNCRNTKEDSWLLKVMVAYTIWILLFLIWVSVNSIQRKAILGRSQIGNQKHGKRWRKQKNMKLSAAEVMVTAVSVILIVGNLCFAVAVTVGIFRYQEM
ncbi:hypothetical protein EPR50_G00097980 [Perca flavescens]|uniref:Reelin domain-containing protein n=1 Tax=Perca flavescens TaxID=8167 RepID=A0A484CZU2_PERFV|nr:hypothetical protein EPR50_G00097980 [Perca flavescens]